jgi:hypothetical protein
MLSAYNTGLVLVILFLRLFNGIVSTMKIIQYQMKIIVPYLIPHYINLKLICPKIFEQFLRLYIIMACVFVGGGQFTEASTSMATCACKKSKKVKQSRYTPWRHMGGEEGELLLILNLGTRWG